MGRRECIEKWAGNSQEKKYKWLVEYKMMFNITSNQKCKIKQDTFVHLSH